MKILVTGGAGFIASNITDAYVKLGHEVVVVDNLSSGKKSNLNSRAKFYRADIADAKKMAAIFEAERPALVNHHAAQIDVRKSVADPVFDAKTNIIGTINLLENCVKHGVEKIIFASSGGVMYGECGGAAPDESRIPMPMSPYGVAKRTVELYLNYYSASYDFRYTALRYGNVYGPRQDPHGEAGVVAIFIKNMMAGEPVIIFGDGEQMRDYVFVDDIVAANVLSLDLGDYEIINIGTGRTESVNALFSELSGISGYTKKPVYKSARRGELFKSSLNAAKAKKILGWSAKTDFASGISKTYEYFLSHEKRGRL